MWLVIGFVAVAVVGSVIAGRRLLLPSDNDFHELSWTDAFEQLHNEVSSNYPFTEWKAIDWDALYAQTAPRIAAAEANGNTEAYYMALREFTYAIPDGHVGLAGEDFGLRQKAIGGGYGFCIIGLDDGRVIAHVLLEDGPAASSGMQWGAEILAWNGLPIHEAIAQTETLWAAAPQSTLEGHLLAQYRYLVRDPIGTGTTITFQNPESTSSQTITLVAEDDQLEALKRTLPPEKEAMQALFNSPIQAEILESGAGYLSISGFMPTLGGLHLGKQMDQAISSFIEEDVPGIIIDVRGNGGGIDALVPQLMSHFFDVPDFYEHIAYFDSASSQFKINPDDTLRIEPQTPYYSGPVLVLVDINTMSTAEGPPLVAQRLPQGQVVGVNGTNGSFAMGAPGQNLYQLPEGLAFNFLAGRALDENQQIQVDANADGVGGIVPDVRVPMTEETAYAMFVEGRDVVLETAVSTLNESTQ